MLRARIGDGRTNYVVILGAVVGFVGRADLWDGLGLEVIF